jgi:hypothetical protein
MFDWRGERRMSRWLESVATSVRAARDAYPVPTGRGITFEDVVSSEPLVATAMDAAQFASLGEHELCAMLEAALRRQ